jgi:hypothetical protein
MGVDVRRRFVPGEGSTEGWLQGTRHVCGGWKETSVPLPSPQLCTCEKILWQVFEQKYEKELQIVCVR